MWHFDVKVLPKKTTAAIALSVGAIVGGFFVYVHNSYPTTSVGAVLSDLVYARQHPHVSLSKQTIAFLPYWRLGTIQYARYDLLSEVNFFSLTIGPDGHIVQVSGNQTEPGWRWWNTQQVKDLIPKVQISGDSFGLTLAMLNNSDFSSFLRSSNAQQNLISDTLAQIHSRNLNAITLDLRTFGQLKSARCRWDKDAEEPVCRYINSKGVRHQVWFENNHSVVVKYSYAKANGFGGIAIWVLGYDSKYPDLWSIMRTSLRT